MQEGIEQYIMEVVPSSECEAKGVDSFVALGDEGYEHSVAEEVEAPVVLDDGKEGEDAKRRRARALTREGCKALMTVRRRDCGRWYVAKLEKKP
ncbi:protein FAR1-RELATED SEQUENCE 5 [Prunus yedoensis var. nudiflora]|uniref:Protein FAR1-RELATED SEQUENCE 5 n=1 Tax=Prunus yedoensis var. nudiflora TaxID=2094558 RepID=A0A314YZB3_PRUYE|nr:protein FAR1-RELATED SEQUENCE 5 [Prunus yedoensis var. nudiflora]